jgi:Flp pilus assembly pilin Flp
MGARYYIAKRNIRPNSLQNKHIRDTNSAGQTLVEYALILALITVVAIGVLLSMGGQVGNVYSTVNNQLYASKYGGVTSRGH